MHTPREQSPPWRNLVLLLLGLGLAGAGRASADESPAANLWDLARSKQAVHRFSTLFTAQDVRHHLANESGLEHALEWCKQTAVTKVYIESFRDG